MQYTLLRSSQEPNYGTEKETRILGESGQDKMGCSREMCECKLFSQSSVNEWNKLSADCVHSSSINMFKNRIDNYLVEYT